MKLLMEPEYTPQQLENQFLKCTMKITRITSYNVCYTKLLRAALVRGGKIVKMGKPDEIVKILSEEEKEEMLSH